MDRSSKTIQCLGFKLERTPGAWASGDKQGRLTVPWDMFGSLLQARLHSTQWFLIADNLAPNCLKRCQNNKTCHSSENSFYKWTKILSLEIIWAFFCTSQPYKSSYFNPIPTGTGLNQPLYSYHVTQAGRNRVKGGH